MLVVPMSSPSRVAISHPAKGRGERLARPSVPASHERVCSVPTVNLFDRMLFVNAFTAIKSYVILKRLL